MLSVNPRFVHPPKELSTNVQPYDLKCNVRHAVTAQLKHGSPNRGNERLQSEAGY